MLNFSFLKGNQQTRSSPFSLSDLLPSSLKISAAPNIPPAIADINTMLAKGTPQPKILGNLVFPPKKNLLQKLVPDKPRSSISFLPEATKEATQKLLGYEPIKPDEPFAKYTLTKKILMTVAEVVPAELTIMKEFGKSAYGFLATAPVNIKALATNTEAPEEVKIP